MVVPLSKLVVSSSCGQILPLTLHVNSNGIEIKREMTSKGDIPWSEGNTNVLRSTKNLYGEIKCEVM